MGEQKRNIVDLLSDDSFHAYVNKSDKPSAEKWQKWLERHPEHANVVEKASLLVRIFNVTGKHKLSFSKDEEYQKLQKNIGRHELIAGPSNRNKFKPWLSIAASVAVLLTLLTVYLIYNNVTETSKPVLFNEISSPKGSKSKIVLEDGTSVWLNAESTLKYPTKFNDDSRKVCLTGEAYFDVKKDTKRPFIVRTGDIKINVLGTSFNVKNYPEDEVIETILETGVLNIRQKTKNGNDPYKQITLKPNQKLILHKSNLDANLVVSSKPFAENNGLNPSKPAIPKKRPKLYKNIETEPYTAWKDHRLIFNEENLESLAKRLERWYDVNIIIKDEPAKYKTLTGVFEKETVEQAISAICLTTELNFSIDKDTIKIYK